MERRSSCVRCGEVNPDGRCVVSRSRQEKVRKCICTVYVFLMSALVYVNAFITLAVLPGVLQTVVVVVYVIVSG